MNRSPRLGCCGAAPYRPRAGFVLPRGKKRNKVKKLVARFDEVVEAVVCHTELATEIRTLVIMYIREVALDARIHDHVLGILPLEKFFEHPPAFAVFRIHVDRSALPVENVENRFYREQMQ